MKKIVVLFIVVGLLVAGAYHLGWFSVSVNKEKIDKDMAATKTKVEEMEKSSKEALGKAYEQGKEGAAKATEAVKDAAGKAVEKTKEAVQEVSKTVVKTTPTTTDLPKQNK